MLMDKLRKPFDTVRVITGTNGSTKCMLKPNLLFCRIQTLFTNLKRHRKHTDLSHSISLLEIRPVTRGRPFGGGKVCLMFAFFLVIVIRTIEDRKLSIHSLKKSFHLCILLTINNQQSNSYLQKKSFDNLKT